MISIQYPVIIISEVIDISRNGRGNVLLNNYIIDKLVDTINGFDACLTADSWVASLILARSHTFVEIDQEIISTVILLPSADSFKKGCCQLQAKVCAQITG